MPTQTLGDAKGLGKGSGKTPRLQEETAKPSGVGADPTKSEDGTAKFPLLPPAGPCVGCVSKPGELGAVSEEHPRIITGIPTNYGLSSSIFPTHTRGQSHPHRHHPASQTASPAQLKALPGSAK